VTATGEFEIASWDEDTYQELEGEAKLTRASVTQTFTGDISGTGDVQWLMCYGPDGTARFVGLQRVQGTIGGRSGSFVIESPGDFDGARAAGQWSILPGSGTDGLAGIRGEGGFEAPLGSKASYMLDYSFE
jgi:hypothetical protein